MKQTAVANSITVCFWNILFDVFKPSKVPTQAERMPALLEALQQLPETTIFGFAEVEGHNSRQLIDGLSAQQSLFIEHDRPDSHIGILSNRQPLGIRSLSLDKNCTAVIAENEQVTIAVVHLTFAFLGERLHHKQLQILMQSLDLAKPTIIMGDFNSCSWQRSRRYLKNTGFESVFKDMKRQPTAPTKEYRHLYPWPFPFLSRIGFTADDIYIHKLRLAECGLINGESDHKAVWAELQL